MAGKTSEPDLPKPRRSQRRGLARLAAVQALYQIAASDAPAEDVIGEFVRYRLKSGDVTDDDAGPAGEADVELFLAIVRGAVAEREMLDRMIQSSLAEGWALQRMDKVLLAILRAGAWELFARADVPPRVAITEYVDVAHAFFDGKEPGFVNGVLDRLAHVLRAGDMAPRTPDAGGA